MKKQAAIFPGQGAQYSGMGKDFYDHYLQAKEIFQWADDLLSRPLSKLIFTGSEEELAKTNNSQVAIFVTSMAIFKTVQKEISDFKPSLFGGLSLGEYSALCASEKISFEECLKIVSLRGAFMQEASEKRPGTMMAVLGLKEEDLVDKKNFWIANINSPGQIVVACRKEDEQKVEQEIKALGAKRVIPLKVAGAFHTPLMDSAREELKPYIEEASILETSSEIVMNVPGNFVSKSGLIKQYLIEQVSSLTRWVDCMEALSEQKPTFFIETGPTLLTAMNKRMNLSAPTIKIATIEDMDYAYESLTR